MKYRPSPLATVATDDAIEYALDRANAVERKHPLLALVYRTVAEVLTVEKERGEE